MALTKAQIREILSSAGVDGDHMSDAVEAITNGHTASIEALREERDTQKKEVERLTKELEEANEAMKNGDKSPYKVKYEAAVKEKEDLQKEFDDYKADLANKETHSKKEKAYTGILKDAGISEKHFAKIIKYSDVDSLELDEEGKVKDSKKILDAIKDEWGDHISSSSTQGARTETPPANNGGTSDKPSRAAILAQQYHEDRYGKAE